MNDEEKYWSERYQNSNTGWDIGYPSTPLKEYIDQLEDKTLKILIPGAGNGYEAEYLWKQGFKNVYVLDISEHPLESLKLRISTFPDNQLVKDNFFTHVGKYDLILEQTFFCSFEPSKVNRKVYAKQINSLLNPKGKLVGLWFNHDVLDGAKRPFGGSKKEYLEYLSPYFETIVFDSCYNSIKPRMGKELFGIFVKK